MLGELLVAAANADLLTSPTAEAYSQLEHGPHVLRPSNLDKHCLGVDIMLFEMSSLQS